MKPPEDKPRFKIECPKCQHKFLLLCDDSVVPDTLIIGSCDSGGVYSIKVVCPKCYYEQELW